MARPQRIPFYCHTCEHNFTLLNEEMQQIESNTDLFPRCTLCGSEFVEQVESNALDVPPTGSFEEQGSSQEMPLSSQTGSSESSSAQPHMSVRQHSHSAPAPLNEPRTQPRFVLYPVGNGASINASIADASPVSSLTFIFSDPSPLRESSSPGSEIQGASRPAQRNVDRNSGAFLSATVEGLITPLLSSLVNQRDASESLNRPSQERSQSEASAPPSFIRRRPRTDSVSESQPRSRHSRVEGTLSDDVPASPSSSSSGPAFDPQAPPSSTAEPSNTVTLIPEIEGNFETAESLSNLLRSLFPQSDEIMAALNAHFPHLLATQPQDEGAAPTRPHVRFRFVPVNIVPSSTRVRFPSATSGIFGDYAINERSFDDIISHLLEQESLRYMPPVATDEMISLLKRVSINADLVREHGECIICKELFVAPQEANDGPQSTNSGPVDDAVILLGCNHLFHEACLIPWLKKNGTCPICRFSVNKEHEARQPKPTSTPPPSPTSETSDTA